jgi:hypothetical protein
VSAAKPEHKPYVLINWFTDKFITMNEGELAKHLATEELDKMVSNYVRGMK